MAFTITQSCTGCTACARRCPVGAISGERKRLHVIDPTMCIECGACGRICPDQAVLDGRGRTCSFLKIPSWPKPRVDAALCMSCKVCVDGCPTSCLGMFKPQDSREPREYATLERPRDCIACVFCSLECPVGAIAMVTPGEQ